MASAPADSFFVYILRCSDGSLYVGRCANLKERLKRHNDARAALGTATRRPVHLVYHEEHPSEASALARERQLKRWSHNKKLALVGGNAAALKSLAKRRVH